MTIPQRRPVTSRREVRAQDKLALETARLETVVCLDDLIEGDPLGDVRADGAGCQQPEEPLQVFAEPGGMSRPHHIDRVAAHACRQATISIDTYSEQPLVAHSPTWSAGQWLGIPKPIGRALTTITVLVAIAGMFANRACGQQVFEPPAMFH
jgi:hypothetical protein